MIRCRGLSPRPSHPIPSSSSSDLTLLSLCFDTLHTLTEPCLTTLLVSMGCAQESTRPDRAEQSRTTYRDVTCPETWADGQRCRPAAVFRVHVAWPGLAWSVCLCCVCLCCVCVCVCGARSCLSLVLVLPSPVQSSLVSADWPFPARNCMIHLPHWVGGARMRLQPSRQQQLHKQWCESWSWPALPCRTQGSSRSIPCVPGTSMPQDGPWSTSHLSSDPKVQ